MVGVTDTEKIKTKILEQLDPSIEITPDYEGLAEQLALLWDLAPNFARKIETHFVAICNSLIESK